MDSCQGDVVAINSAASVGKANQRLLWGVTKAVCRDRDVNRRCSRRSRKGQADLTSGSPTLIISVESILDMPQTIKNRVKDLRTSRGWTQQQLADAVGVSRQSINSIECERYIPSLPLALMFARVFGLPTDEIFKLEKKR
jgi:putative transcriptional regulator